MKATKSDMTIKPSFLNPRQDKMSLPSACNVKSSNSFVNSLQDKLNKTLLENTILLPPQSVLGTKKSLISDMLKPAISSSNYLKPKNKIESSN